MAVYGPVARSIVVALARTSVKPHHVVFAHTAIGLYAAWLLSLTTPTAHLSAAVLLQLKSVLDNVDGGLARATGQVTQMGRYLDTLMDLIVNAALFVALSRHGPSSLALVGFVALTLILSLEFNASWRYETVRAGAAPGSAVPAGAAARYLRLLHAAYSLLLAPQDRLFRGLDEWLFKLASGSSWADASPLERERWADSFSVAALVNFGLTTQMFVLGLCAALGSPYAYVVVVMLQIVLVVLIQAVRVHRHRHWGEA